MSDFQNMAAIVGDYVRQNIDADLPEAIDLLEGTRALRRALEKLESGLTETIRNNGTGQHVGLECVAIVSASISKRLDVARLKTEKPKIYDAYLTESESVRVTVKRGVAI